MIRILLQRFTEIGIENEQSVGDAHVFTVKKALEMAKHYQTTVASNDRRSCVTDVSLVLHNEGRRVRYDQKRQQEGTRGIFSQGSQDQAAPNTICYSPMPGQVACTSAIQNQGKLNTLQQLKSFQV